VGYVYSSAHTSDDRAAEILRGYLGKDAADLPMLPIKFKSGYRHQPWVKNCVAVGLAGGFLEPLESTGIVTISAAAEMIADFLPGSGANFESAAKAFNSAMVQRYERAIDFVKLHYCLSGRCDTDFWRENVDRKSWGDRLPEKVDMWRERLPSHYDISSTHESFGLASWRFILYGMGFKTDLSQRLGAYPHIDEAKDVFRRIALLNQEILKQLPTHRALIDEVHATGFRPKAEARPAMASAG
jgi:tryptophan halogenase